jgi:hypothetical protein
LSSTSAPESIQNQSEAKLGNDGIASKFKSPISSAVNADRAGEFRSSLDSFYFACLERVKKKTRPLVLSASGTSS